MPRRKQRLSAGGGARGSSDTPAHLVFASTTKSSDLLSSATNNSTVLIVAAPPTALIRRPVGSRLRLSEMRADVHGRVSPSRDDAATQLDGMNQASQSACAAAVVSDARTHPHARRHGARDLSADRNSVHPSLITNKPLIRHCGITFWLA